VNGSEQSDKESISSIPSRAVALCGRDKVDRWTLGEHYVITTGADGPLIRLDSEHLVMQRLTTTGTMHKQQEYSSDKEPTGIRHNLVLVPSSHPRVKYNMFTSLPLTSCSLTELGGFCHVSINMQHVYHKG
jgi:hypothetical protein